MGRLFYLFSETLEVESISCRHSLPLDPSLSTPPPPDVAATLQDTLMVGTSSLLVKMV